MSTFFSKIRYLPVALGATYLATTILLFFAGPFDWPIRNADVLTMFLSACVAGIVLGFLIGSYVGVPRQHFAGWRMFFRFGAVASVILLFPSTWVYTGKWPWEIVSVLGDQGEAYREMLAALEANESGIRPYVAVVRAVLAPFVFCVIPFGILRWRELRRADVALLVLHIIAILIFSLMRGTDRETGDLLIIVGATFMVVMGRLGIKRGRFPFSASKFVVASVAFGLFLCATFFLFVDRKESRMGGSDAFCVAEGVVCSVRDANEDPLRARATFGLEMMTAYASQGYYGLSLALEENFTSTYGLGHSAFLMSFFSSNVDESLYQRSYVAKLRAVGWDDKSNWSTLFSWIASDIGFPIVPVVMVVFGAVWAIAWKSAVQCTSDIGALIFLYSCLLVFYIPANNQLTQTVDSYFSALFWFFLWVMKGYPRAACAAGFRR
ncbi:hypothetical protein [Thauera sinica]|uniref:Oligosaccharide repeat unit polymerase n=1 Tax=Thauera sinica TaxID=2665146 RepID=A0ABW1APH7_9RHOO|nr:hypothetical protein [Thauera sp. K11]ATE62280.1 hypothetical protein CCZ27_21910 [Thauera sp. K11]